MLLFLAVVVFAGESSAAAARTSAQSCGTSRNTGKRTPTWWPGVRALAVENIAYFPPGMPLAYIGAWIERESGGRYNVKSSLGEVGYFQLHPEEIDEMVGKSRRRATMAEIVSSPTQSMRWGGRYLSRYDAKLTALGVKRGTNTYFGLLKAMHWNPVHTPRWIKHVRHAKGQIPADYGDFINAARLIKVGVLPRAREVTKPANLPSCSAFYVLNRVSHFVTAEDTVIRAAVGTLLPAIAVGSIAAGLIFFLWSSSGATA